MKLAIDFRQMLQPGAAQMNDRVDEHLLSELQASEALDVQFSRAALEKSPGWLKLVGITATGKAVLFDANSEAVTFPDHADYDLGKRWTIDVTVKPTNLSAQYPVYARLDASNNKITELEITTGGAFLFTHRDSNGTETTLTSAHTISAGETAHVRVQRFFDELRIIVNRMTSSTRTDIADYDTAPAATKFFVGNEPDTDGDTISTTSLRGTVDELRMWREEVRDDSWAFSEYPWFTDDRLVLYARFNETSGAVTDSSKNGNDGTATGATQGQTALVTALASIQKVFYTQTSTKKQNLVWSNGSLYAVDVQ